jgi:RimJ/RimL family protein N-acetyltransferase
MELLGEKIKLRPIEKSDMDDFYNWWNDPEFAGEYVSEYSKTRSEVEELVRGASFFIIENRREHKKIGFVVYYLVRSDYLYLFEIGYRIMPSERNKGFATEATRLLLDHLFTTKKEIERIESVTDVANVPSQRVLEKNGFKRECEMRKRAFNRGQYKNEYMYSLLREEWKELRIMTKRAR